MANVKRKDVIISLKQKILDLKAQHVEEKRLLVERTVAREVRKKKAAIREVRAAKNKAFAPRINRNVKAAKQLERQKLTQTASELADIRVQRIKMKIVKHIDGALAFPIILNYARECGITAQEMAALIVLCSLKEARATNFTEWGYSIRSAHVFLTRLCEYGLAEKFGDKNALYTPNPKGRKVFLGFKTYFKYTVQRGVFNETGRVKRHNWPE